MSCLIESNLQYVAIFSKEAEPPLTHTKHTWLQFLHSCKEKKSTVYINIMCVFFFPDNFRGTAFELGNELKEKSKKN